MRVMSLAILTATLALAFWANVDWPIGQTSHGKGETSDQPRVPAQSKDETPKADSDKPPKIIIIRSSRLRTV